MFFSTHAKGPVESNKYLLSVCIATCIYHRSFVEYTNQIATILWACLKKGEAGVCHVNKKKIQAKDKAESKE